MNYALSDYTTEELQQRKAELEMMLDDITHEIRGRRLNLSRDLAARLKTIFEEATENGIEIIFENRDTYLCFGPANDIDNPIKITTRLSN